MPRHQKAVTLLKSFGVVLWLVNQAGAPAQACSCFESPATTEQALKGYDAVFRGQIREMRLRSNDLPARPDGSASVEGIEIVARVLETWKGTNEVRVMLFTNPDSASCGYPFAIGREYLIWATRSQDELTVSLCGRTKEIGTAGATTDHQNLIQIAETWKWHRVAAPGFTLLLPGEFGPDSAGTKLRDLDDQLLGWGAPLRPPKAGGWSFVAEKLSYEYVRRQGDTGRPRCESQVAGREATIRHVTLQDGQRLISVHWPDVAPGNVGLTLRCVPGPDRAKNGGDICMRVFNSVEFGEASN